MGDDSTSHHRKRGEKWGDGIKQDPVAQSPEADLGPKREMAGGEGGRNVFYRRSVGRGYSELGFPKLIVGLEILINGHWVKFLTE